MTSHVRPPVNRPMLMTLACGCMAAVVMSSPARDMTAIALTGMSAFVGIPAAIAAVRGLVWDVKNRKRLRAAKTSSGEHGRARFATFKECESRGLYDPSNSPLLGLHDDVPLWASRKAHIAIVAGTGGGKTSALLVGACLDALLKGQSVIVSDSKAEFAHMLSETARALGFRVFFNNPARIAPWPHDDANPFRSIVEAANAGGNAVTLADELAQGLSVEVKDDKNGYFVRLERNALVVIVLSLAISRPAHCYPAQVWKTLTDPRLFVAALESAARSDAFEGDLAAMANDLMELSRSNPEHLGSARKGAANALTDFKSSSSFGKVGALDAFDPLTLRDPDLPPAIVFDLFPQDSLNVARKPNSIMQTERLTRFRKHPEGRPITFVIDEATAFPVHAIVESIETQRQYGMRTMLAFQSYQRLSDVYGERKAEGIRSNCIKILFAVGDLKMAKEASEFIGPTTIQNTTSSGLDGDQRVQRSNTPTGVSLMTPDDILAMPPGKMLVFVPGMRPIMLDKLPWYEIDPLKDIVGENPFERHPKSEVTRLIIDYPAGAHELRLTRIPDLEERKARARSRESRAMPRGQFPLSWRSLLWAPIAAGFVITVWAYGTPHLRISYGERAAIQDCTYLGFEGVRPQGEASACPIFALLKHKE